ncbi:class I SAM-dependent methyltransferase [Streptomyces sp. McG8]|uniref:class I SAM-dependent methyltransferase n=1 Tax=Streptomyces sp. McG8 TaxID=2725487 RepID=UPI001BE73391|nr:class I SAM-dependent methyltransferase [Streptomyces sp. McG8]
MSTSPHTDYWAAQRYQIIADQLAPISHSLCAAAGLRPGQRVLDVATATGNAAIAAAQAGCAVSAVDLDPGMIEAARQRAETHHLDVHFQVADAQQLPFATDTFDVVLSTYGVMFAPDHRRAATELHRVCRPGGRIVLANWTPHTLIARVFDTIAHHAPDTPDITAAAQAWGTTHGLRTLFGPDIGVTTSPCHCHIHYASCSQWAEIFTNNFGPAARVAHTRPQALRPLCDALLELFHEYNQSDDTGARIRHDYLQALITKSS